MKGVSHPLPHSCQGQTASIDASSHPPRAQARQHRSHANHCTQCQGQTLSIDLGAVCWPLKTEANTAFSFAEELFSFFSLFLKFCFTFNYEHVSTSSHL